MAEYTLTQEEKELVAKWIAKLGYFRMDHTADCLEAGIERDDGSHYWLIREDDAAIAMDKMRAFMQYADKIQFARARQWMKDAEEL